MTDLQHTASDALPRSASALGFLCEKDEQGNWQIRTHGHSDHWYLQQDYQRWLLVINGVPQILFQRAEAIAFIKRWTIAQQRH